jgi:hypothetical protein
MREKTALIVTSISAPNPVLESLARGSVQNDVEFIVIGDEKSPSTFDLDGCRFYGLDEQRKLDFAFAKKCPTRHYARKNIGYLLALRNGATAMVETDDDNFPEDAFWSDRQRRQLVPLSTAAGHVNVYRYFSEVNIWPRGLPLDKINTPLPAFESLPKTETDCPIQQGLANENPDVDAIYRLVLPLPQNFRRDRRIALGDGSWCPFNSQNTTWWRDAFPLLYLPAYCSFRMTDIWRSFVAQRIAWANGWSILFHEPTVWQARNEHNLMRDFRDEVPGYLHNAAICDALAALQIKPGVANLGENLRACYAKLIEQEWVGDQELELVDAWLHDLDAIR